MALGAIKRVKDFIVEILYDGDLDAEFDNFLEDTVQQKPADYTILDTDNIIEFDATGGAVTGTLPTAVGIAGKKLFIVKTDSSTNAVTIDGNLSEFINGNLTWQLISKNDGVKLRSNGANWFIDGFFGTVFDINSNELISFTPVASAVNYVDFANAVSGNNPGIAGKGDDTNVWLKLSGQGAGGVYSDKPFSFSKGADIASASALSLGSDGNFFDVTGTTTILSIASVRVGVLIGLQFDGILTLTHHATNLFLPSKLNITTEAGDVGLFYEYAAGKWRCISYSRASTSFSEGGEAGGANRTIGNTDAYDFALKTNNIEQITIEGLANAGIISFPNQSSFGAVAASNQNITASSTTKVLFGTKKWDSQTEFASSKFTVKKAGKYLVTASLYWGGFTSPGSDYDVRGMIYKNGVEYNRLNHEEGGAGSNDGFNIGLSRIMDLAVSDYIEIYIYQDSAYTPLIVPPSGFEAIRIS